VFGELEGGDGWKMVTERKTPWIVGKQAGRKEGEGRMEQKGNREG
jgi:hypothetical protein